MWQVMISAMMRRKRWTILLICVVMVEVCAAMMLCTLTARQEAALEKTIDNTVISCVVTSAKGTNQDDLHMATGLVDILLGHKHEKGYYQDEYIKNVRSKASIRLITPQDYTLVCLLTPDSDCALTAVEGGSLTLFDGWDDSVFAGDEKVCVTPKGYASEGNYLEITTSNFSLTLRIIGTHTGSENIFYCPFHTMDSHDGMSYMVTADSCSFDIKDTYRLDDAKESLYELFVKPDIHNQQGSITFGVRIEDDIFQSTIEEIKGNIRTLHLLIPVLLLIEGAVGFFASYLSTQSRLREYAVMRCLGMKRGEVFRVALSEHLLIALVGGVLGTVVGVAIDGTITFRILLYGVGGVAAFLIGTALSVSRVTRINVMKLMKTEE